MPERVRGEWVEVVQVVQTQHGSRRDGPGRSERGDRMGRVLADALGWFSLGLGVAQIAAPDRLNRQIGVFEDGRNRSLMRGMGAREIAHGIGILRGSKRVALGSRVVGDAMDLTLLGGALGANRNKRSRRRKTEIALASVAGVTLLDLIASARTARSSAPPSEERIMRDKASVTVKRPIDEVYLYWHDIGNFPHFMKHLQSASIPGPRRFRRKSQELGEVEFEIEITDEAVNEFIEWRSTPDSAAEHTGSVRFGPAPGGRGTEVKVEIDYGPKGIDSTVSTVAKIVGEKIHHQLRDDLRRFKQVLETGEVVRSEGSPEGFSTGQLLKQRPAQPVP